MRAAGVARTGAAIATAGAASAGRVRALGAAEVLDYHEPGWPERVRALTGGGADAAVNAARGTITITAQPGYPLAEAAAALDRARPGAHGAAVVLEPASP